MMRITLLTYCFFLIISTISAEFKDDGSNLPGLDKLDYEWHKITHHKTKFMLVKDCESIHETVNIYKRDNKHYLSHQTLKGKVVYEIIGSEESGTLHHPIITLRLRHTHTSAEKPIKIKLGKHRTIWYGLSSSASTDIFIIEDFKHNYKKLHLDCD